MDDICYHLIHDRVQQQYRFQMVEFFHAICKYQGKSVVTKLIQTETLEYLRDFVEQNWVGSIRNGGLLSYNLLGNDNCQLLSEEDYQNLWIMKQVFDLKHIEINIHDTSREGSSSTCVSCDDISLADNVSQISHAIVQVDNEVGLDDDDDLRANIPTLLCDSWKNIIRHVGQEFHGGAVVFREVLQKFSIKQGFDYRFVKNEPRRITVECTKRVDMGCNWCLHASSDATGVFFYIREYVAEHTCVLGFMNRSSRRMSSSIVAKEIFHNIEIFPLTKPGDIVKDFGLKYGVDLTYSTAYKGVEKAKAIHFGNFKTSYDQLKIYIDRSLICNPGSHMVIDVDEESKCFRRTFISFYATTEGFNYCRPLICLDATFLTGRYKGQLLCATAKDGNNNLFPVDFGIVDIEDEDNWTWFLREFSVILKGREIVFISDCQKGLLESVANVFPRYPHSSCTIHMKANLKFKISGKPLNVKDSILTKFNQVAYSYTAERFERKIQDLKKSVGEEVVKWLDTLPPENYVHAYFPGKRYEEMTSNAAKSLNAKYRKIRQLPVYRLVDGIRTFLMFDMSEKREASLKWTGQFTPNITKKIKDGIEFGMSWIVYNSSEWVYEVRAKKPVSVDLLLKTCSCCFWQSNSFPCAHAFVAIHRSKEDLAKFVDPYYHNVTNRMVYALPMILIDTIDMPLSDQNNLQVLPPKCKRQPGRPKRKRGHGPSDSKRQYKCGRCKKFGHNCSTCKEPVQD